jgi:hypothetical protein
MSYPENDLDFEEAKIDTVKGDERSGWVITHDGLSFDIPKESPIHPRVGMIVRFYPRATFVQKRGLFLDGVSVFYKTEVEALKIRQEWLMGYKLEEERRKQDPKNPEPQIDGFDWTDDMAEISGFHGGYEKACRTMVSQGCKWWNEHPEAKPKVMALNNVFGLAVADNEDAKNLEAAMVQGIDDFTGAMHQAALSHVFLWHRSGSWMAYQKKSREMNENDAHDENDRA